MHFTSANLWPCFLTSRSQAKQEIHQIIKIKHLFYESQASSGLKDYICAYPIVQKTGRSSRNICKSKNPGKIRIISEVDTSKQDHSPSRGNFKEIRLRP